jgi:hypothetical protein
MFLLPKGIRWHEPHAGKQLCIGPCAFICYFFIFFNRDLSALSLSISRSGGAAPCSLENPADRHLQKDVPRHEAQDAEPHQRERGSHHEHEKAR